MWPPGFGRIPQGQGSLGDRMGRVFRTLPPGPALIIGADIPSIKPSNIEDGFRRLGANDAVLGPSDDGGYWMIGLSRGAQATPRGLFHGVRWSTGNAMSDTVTSLAPLRVGFGATLHDVDHPEDLRPNA